MSSSASERTWPLEVSPFPIGVSTSHRQWCGNLQKDVVSKEKQKVFNLTISIWLKVLYVICELGDGDYI